MKLDIEALAREAQVGDSHGHFIRHYLPELKALARLIVERCAVECDRFNDPYEAACAADDCAAAIRQLLEDTP